VAVFGVTGIYDIFSYTGIGSTIVIFTPRKTDAIYIDYTK